jgi:hypothetical protein
MRSAANAGAAEDQRIVQELDALDAVHLGFGLPGEFANIPARLGNVLIGPAPAGLEHRNAITLLGRSEGGHASAEA